jgi:hypothetical protein
MTWKITLAYIDDNTGEYTHIQESLTDQRVNLANVDALEFAFNKLKDQLQFQLKEQTT